MLGKVSGDIMYHFGSRHNCQHLSPAAKTCNRDIVIQTIRHGKIIRNISLGVIIYFRRNAVPMLRVVTKCRTDGKEYSSVSKDMSCRWGDVCDNMKVEIAPRQCGR